MKDKDKAVIEAILFSMGDSVELKKIAKVINQTIDYTKELIEEMIDEYKLESRGVTIIQLENSYQMCAKENMYDYIMKLATTPVKPVMTNVMLETLSIIAYKQPITKLEIEKIRGVKSDFAVNKLIEYNLVVEMGRLDAPGKPIIFGTTEEFLKRFGLTTIKNLPSLDNKAENIKKEIEKELKKEI